MRFVQESENLDFAGAIEWLAERFRVPLEYEETSPQQDAARRRKERLTALLDQATAYFERVLWETEAGAPVREYLASRGLGEEIAKEFRLGLSRGSGLVAKARESGFSVEEIRAAGLANQRGNDYFPFRLMFPLTDARGRVIGFQARRLRDDDPLKGKYVNTPESELFKKGNVLYGLHLARPADREAGPRDRRRGEHRRDRAPPGRGRAGGRVDGNRADREPAAGARAGSRSGSSSASTRTRPDRRRRCAGWSSR